MQSGGRVIELDPAPDRTREYLGRLHEKRLARLDQGRAEYGNRSFCRPAVALIDEVQQELEDVQNWGAILWCRLEHIKETLREARTDEARSGDAR